MSAIGPGSWLEALGNTPSLDGHIALVRGQVYRCRSLVAPESGGKWMCIGCGRQTALAIDLDHWAIVTAWCPCHFKPGGYRPSEEIQRLLETPVREKERA